MAKGLVITDRVRRLIARVYLQNPDWRAKEIRLEVNDRLLKENPQLPPDWPGLSSIQKELANMRKRESERSLEQRELDRPWSIGTLVDYPIPADAIPKLLGIRAILTEVKSWGWGFTIRQALWAARLHRVVEGVGDLFCLAIIYAWEERICEFTGTKMDTSDYDEVIGRDPYSAFDLFSAKHDQMLPGLQPPLQFEDDSFAKELESEIGIDVERPSFTKTGLNWYLLYLQLISDSENWTKLPRKEKEDYIREIWSHVRKLEKGEDSRTSIRHIVRRFEPDVAGKKRTPRRSFMKERGNRRQKEQGGADR